MNDVKQPITFLHAEECVITATDQPQMHFSEERDTFNILSGDSDTS